MFRTRKEKLEKVPSKITYSLDTPENVGHEKIILMQKEDISKKKRKTEKNM
jgi:hypothetical protein